MCLKKPMHTTAENIRKCFIFKLTNKGEGVIIANIFASKY